ncbi:MAG TPA: hypothetical protein VGQ31_10410 [Candidatus Limnocylindrales bacterium]|nr:hypothetical protein [Candidatus Limnocylindrales bacterium]
MRLAIVLVAALLAGCNALGPPSADPLARPNLGVSNGTTLTVTVFVNGERLAEFPPGGPKPSFDVAALPPLPWSVEARSPSGRILTSMDVKPGDVTISSFPGGDALSGTMGRVDLSCGRLTIWAGGIAPSGSAPSSPMGSPGDCVP